LNALAAQERRLILWLLNDRPSRVSELVKLTGFSQPSVSKHLRVLREAGLVRGERDPSRGRRRFRTYYLNWQPFLEVERWLADMRGGRYGGTRYEPGIESYFEQRNPEKYTQRGTRRIRKRYWWRIEDKPKVLAEMAAERERIEAEKELQAKKPRTYNEALARIEELEEQIAELQEQLIAGDSMLARERGAVNDGAGSRLDERRSHADVEDPLQ
jgi:predicted transcriptional regulator